MNFVPGDLISLRGPRCLRRANDDVVLVHNDIVVVINHSDDVAGSYELLRVFSRFGTGYLWLNSCEKLT